MHRIDTPTRQKDKFGAGKDGFTQGDPQIGTQATQISADFLDSIQEEIAFVIEDKDSGASLDKSKNNQLITAIKNIIRSVGMLATENLIGVIKIATAAQTSSGAVDDAAVTPKKLKLGFNFIASTNGFIAFPSWLGGLIIQWGSIPSISAGANAVITYPTVFPTNLFATIPIAGSNGCINAILSAGGGNSLASFQAYNNLTGTTNTGTGAYLAIGK